MKVDLLQGTLDMLVLKALTWGSMHGYGITRWLEQRTGAALQVEEGSLYPALHRMAKRGWVKSEWGVSENNRRAKFYELTRPGKKELEKETANWSRLSAAISQVVKLKEA